MKDPKQRFEKIEDFIRGKLSPEESKSFRYEIENDPELSEEVKKHRFEAEVMEFLLEEDLREQMQMWDQKTSLQKNSRNNGFFKVLLIIGFVAIACWIIFCFPLKQPTPSDTLINEEPSTDSAPANEPTVSPDPDSPQESSPKPTAPLPQANNRTSVSSGEYLALVEDFYEIPEYMTTSVRGQRPNATEVSLLDKGWEAFNAEDYESAIKFWQQIPPTDTLNYEAAREPLGHAYMSTEQYDKATSVFQSIIDLGLSPAVTDRAEWYLLLSLIPNYDNQQERIEKLLTKMTIPDLHHNFATPARELKTKLQITNR